MTNNHSKRKAHSDTVLIGILEDMLERNETITARAAARKHPDIKHASTITRSSTRTALLASFQEKQRDFRSHIDRMQKRSKEKAASQLTEKDQKIAELEKQVNLLRASHIAMIRAVGELGGMRSWMKLFEDFKAARDDLYEREEILAFRAR